MIQIHEHEARELFYQFEVVEQMAGKLRCSKCGRGLRSIEDFISAIEQLRRLFHAFGVSDD